MSTAPGSTIAASLRKKSTRSKLNRLRQLGEFEFRRIVDPGEFDRVLSDIVPFYDVRLALLSGTAPFASDPVKIVFYRALFSQPGLLHVTALCLNQRVIAAHIGVINKNQVCLGILAHSPFFGQQSVGKLLVLLLGAELEREGFDAFDLTPGGEYKNRFASRHDEAHALTIFFSRAAAFRYRMSRALGNVSKRSISAVQANRAFATVLSGLMSAARNFGRHYQPHKRLTAIKVHVSVLQDAPLLKLGGSRLMHRDAVEDLLLYERAESSQPSRSEFLRTALDRFGRHCHFYSRIEDGRLVHWGWLAERTNASDLGNAAQAVAASSSSAWLFDCYTHPQYRDRGFLAGSLAQMLVDAIEVPDTQEVGICYLANDVSMRRTIETIIPEVGVRRTAS
jgi:hypothetical protein